MSNDLAPFISAQLTALGLPVFGGKGNRPNINTFCPRGHDKDTPSLSIRKTDGRFYCFGCREVRGHNWNHMAKWLQINTLAEEDLPDPLGLFSKDIEDRIRKAQINFELPWDLEPWVGDYQHSKSVCIPESTLQALDAFRWYDGALRCYRILFPVRQYGDLRGWVARRIDRKKKDKPYKMKYRNALEMSSLEILYPLDIVEKMETNVVVLVEGPFDAIRLLNYDIPALAIMGTGNWNAESSCIDLLNVGAERIILAMDSDAAGKKARKEIGPSLARDFKVQDFYCPNKQDPGNISIPYMDKLWKMTRP